MNAWTIVANTAAGTMVVGRFETLEKAEDRVEQITAAQASNPFPAPALSIKHDASA